MAIIAIFEHRLKIRSLQANIFGETKKVANSSVCSLGGPDMFTFVKIGVENLMALSLYCDLFFRLDYCNS